MWFQFARNEHFAIYIYSFNCLRLMPLIFILSLINRQRRDFNAKLISFKLVFISICRTPIYFIIYVFRTPLSVLAKQFVFRVYLISFILFTKIIQLYRQKNIFHCYYPMKLYYVQNKTTIWLGKVVLYYTFST